MVHCREATGGWHYVSDHHLSLIHHLILGTVWHNDLRPASSSMRSDAKRGIRLILLLALLILACLSTVFGHIRQVYREWSPLCRLLRWVVLGLIHHTFRSIRCWSSTQSLLHTGWIHIQLLLLLQLLLLFKVLLGNECVRCQTEWWPSFLTLPWALLPLLRLKVSCTSTGVIWCFRVLERNRIYLLWTNCAGCWRAGLR